MKRQWVVGVFLLAGILFAGVSTCLAQDAQVNTAAQELDGTAWMHSSAKEKKAFLLGAGSAIVLEYHVREKYSQEPSVFVKGWVEGLKGISWLDMVNRIDAYYKANPDQMQRHVFEVIWQDIITPNRGS